MNNTKGFLKIMQTVDAFFPIGAFTLSNGLESFVVEEWIKNSADLNQYLTGFLHTFPYQDLGMLHLSYNHADDDLYIEQLEEVGLAMKVPQEIREGSIKMGRRLVKALESMDQVEEKLRSPKVNLHPIILGLYGKASGIEEEMLLYMYGYGLISAIVNNAVKLVPLSQMEGQRVLYNNLAGLEKAVTKALMIDMDQLGVSTPANEIHAMRHERLYSRQYMS